jgi:hypothetical protein
MPLRMAFIKKYKQKQKIRSIGEEVETCSLVVMQTGVLPWKIVWRMLKLKVELPIYDSPITFLGICTKELKSGSQRN